MIVKGVKFNKLETGDEADVDYEMPHANGLFSTHANTIPLLGNVPATRTFYGSRFIEQALPLVHNEAPLVRNMDTETGRSFDYLLGEHMGAKRATADGKVVKITPDELHVKKPDGSVDVVELFHNFPGNRKTLLENTPMVKVGQEVKAGDLLAKSNMTDNEGRMALGRNSVIGLLPYKGFSMDDAVVISQKLADDMASDHAETVEHDPDDTVIHGRDHYVSLFPKKFSPEQVAKLDDNGNAMPGQVIMPGDPVMLMTKPRRFTSQNENVGRLSRAQRFVRKDAAKVWDGSDPATVLDSVKTKGGGFKLLLGYQSTCKPGDKLVLRNGHKGTIAKIISNDQMPRTEAGQPLDLMLNQLGLPSRVNASSFYEMLLGKVAAKTGKPYTLPPFTKNGESMADFVEGEVSKNGVPKEERIYDPVEGRFLDNPVTVGNAHVLKLHHQAGKKLSSRGQASYSMDDQPLRGGGSGGGAQRLSSLEMNVLHSSGARGVQKEAILLRGEKRDDFWRQFKNNRTAPKLDRPFVWDKFLALLSGTGVNAKDLGKGTLRLTPMTDEELAKRGSMKIENDGIVNLDDFTPKSGGLFDPKLVREGKWGHIDLPFPVINPSYEDTVRTLLGLTKPQYEALLEKEPELEKVV